MRILERFDLLCGLSLLALDGTFAGVSMLRWPPGVTVHMWAFRSLGYKWFLGNLGGSLPNNTQNLGTGSPVANKPLGSLFYR